MTLIFHQEFSVVCTLVEVSFRRAQGADKNDRF